MISQLALGFAIYRENYWCAVPLVLVTSHLMHAMLIGFHEATHGLLRKSRLLNEIDGTIIGTLSLMSFSLYRAAHQRHHVHLATQRDEELWPFTDPRMPRRGRILAAVCELTLGIFYTPFLFIRTFLRTGSPIRNAKLRRRDLVGIRADGCGVDGDTSGGRLVTRVEVFPVVAPDSGEPRCEHAKCAQIHRTRRNDRLHD